MIEFDEKMKEVWGKLSPKEREALRIANNAIYFDDNSDYGTALWEIITLLSTGLIEEPVYIGEEL